MERYGIIEKPPKREIVLLKGKPCFWGKCSFCDYIEDNSNNEAEMDSLNRQVLANVSGKYGGLEVINSGNVFELTKGTMEMIKSVVAEKNINKLFFESHWAYHKGLDEIRKYFGIPIVFKCGVETFDNEFRNKTLNKGAYFDSPEEVAKYMDSVCLLVGVKGQTEEMIKRDIEILLNNFKYGCVNVYVENTTNIKADYDLIKWFRANYSYLENYENIDVLWNNTDFGVGGSV